MTRKNRRGTASLSARIPPELRTFLKEMARDRGISEAASVCVLIEKEMGKPSRRPNKQNLMWSEELAKIHKAIIACGKQVNSNRCDRSDYQKPEAQKIIDALVKLVAAVLQLEDAVRRRK